ncbi:MAG TPA: efflux RND transporter periplasmic adaptor subunit [Pirellulales bacterium]|nr:efflux RND transporter periplasmic adaptor subunit [Pirellulales bacterium]
MTQPRQGWRHWTRWAVSAFAGLAFVAGVAALLLWLAGKFEPKVSPSAEPATVGPPRPAGRTVVARLVRVPLTETAVGTIRAVHETAIGSKLLARVVEVNLKAGQHVKAGDVLVQLDDADLKAKLQQAQAAAASAEASYNQAVVDEERYGSLVKTGAVSRQEYDKMATTRKSLEADLRRAKETVNEVQATLDWATIRSPIDGTVIDKKVDAGDMVGPGQLLVTLYDPKQMQLVASVRESLAQRLRVGQDLDVEFQGLQKRCTGSVSEIVPEAQAASRAFLVKVTGPCPKGVYTGMFARMFIPLDEEEVLVVPRQAVRRIGQIELVDVIDGNRAVRRAVRCGRRFDGNVEVLSGLRAGEKVTLPDSDVSEHVGART